jgi:uncharacterized protein YycO
MNYPIDLEVGDIIGFAGEAIVRWKTDGQAGHVGVYIGNGKVVTSLTEHGVCVADLSHNGEAVWVRRTKVHFDLEAAMEWFKTVEGLPYGWEDIEVNAGIPMFGEGKGLNCSHVSAVFLEKGNAPQFDPMFNAHKITPEHFETSYQSVEIWNIKP